MRFVAIVVAACALLQMGAAEARATIIYNLNTTITSANPTGNPLQTDTVSGSITTDGTIGILQTANILGYDLHLIDGLNAGNDYELTPTNSTIVSDSGSALSATASSLSFDFSGSGEFLIQANTPGPFSGYRYFCFSTGGACQAGETISPQNVFTTGVVATGSTAPVGVQVIGQLPDVPTPPGSPAQVPEPASLVLLAAGLARRI